MNILLLPLMLNEKTFCLLLILMVRWVNMASLAISMHVAFALALPSLHSPKASVKSTPFSVLHIIASGLRCLKFSAALFVHLRITSNIEQMTQLKTDEDYVAQMTIKNCKNIKQFKRYEFLLEIYKNNLKCISINQTFVKKVENDTHN